MHTHARGYTLYVYTCDACLSLAWCFGRVACHRGSVRCKSAPTTVRTEPRMDNDCWQLLLLRCVRRESSCPNRAVMQSAEAFQFAFTWINRRLGRMTVQLHALTLRARLAFSRTVCGNPRHELGSCVVLPRPAVWIPQSHCSTVDAVERRETGCPAGVTAARVQR